jgi:HK97 family phage portal protein
MAPASPLSDTGEEKAFVISSLTNWNGILNPDATASAYPYRTHPWVHRCVRVKEQAIGSVPIQLLRDAKPKPVEIETHPVLSMLQHPNEQLSGRDLMMGIVNHLDLCGNALMVIIRGGSSGNLVPLNPRAIKVERNGNQLLGYTYHGDNGKQTFRAEEVLHIKYPSDEDPLWGVSPLQACMRSYLDDVAIRTHNRGLYANSGVPRGVVITDQVISETVVKENRARWESTHSGQNNAGKTAFLTGGFDFKPIGITQQEFDFLEARKFGMDEISATFGVPISKLNRGITDEGNHRSMERQFHLDTMLPLYETIADSINSQMWKLEGLSGWAITDLLIRFDTSNVPVLKQLAQGYELAELQKLDKGALTINEFREDRGLDPVKWGDVWWKPLGLEPTKDATVPVMEEPDEDMGDEEMDGEKSVPRVVPIRTSHRDAGTDYHHKAEDALRWLAFMSRLKGTEAKLASAVSRVFDDLEQRAIARVTSRRSVKDRKPTPAEIESMLFDRLQASVELISAAKKPLKDAQKVGGERGLKLARKRDARFRTADPHAVRALNAQLQRFAEPVAETTWNALKETLLEGFNAGDSESALTDRIRAVMDNRRSDAQRIAATETGAAVNGGIQAGFEQSRVVKTKRWLTAGDEAVRESHRAANGQEVSVKSAFQVGNASLAFPGDPSAPAGEVINCRCTIVPGEIVEEEAGNTVEVVS